MRAIVQRVTSARVVVDGVTVGEIDQGLAVLVGIAADDGPDERRYMIEKLANLRIFRDDEDRMNRSVTEIGDGGGGVLLIPNFTVMGKTAKGRRPSFTDAMVPAEASAYFDAMVQEMSARLPRVASGRFGADMKVTLTNDGPVTVIVETPG